MAARRTSARSLPSLSGAVPRGQASGATVPVALGHTVLATTPEALVEQLPLTDGASGCTITADVRLDNRDELIAALGLARETRTIGDGELILRAYLQWDEDCPTHLLGDFAFAIWDPRERKLFCARDHMGMRQFNYCHVPERLFAFATVDTALLALDGVPGTINQPRIADLIADLEGHDFTSTFFEHVHRLPPAHALTIDLAGLRSRRYWRLEPGPQLELPTDDAYAEAFLEVLTEAVRCRLRTAGGVGAMLSGGLDSTSVAAIAAGLLADDGTGPLKTISAVDNEAPTCAETSAIRSALTIEGLDPMVVRMADFGGKRALLLAEMEEARNPFETHMTMLRSIYMTARDHGLTVVLDGGAGDVVLTSENRIAALLGQGRLIAAAREAKAAQQFWTASPSLITRARDLLAGAWVAFMPIALRAAWRRARLSAPLADARPDFAARTDFPARRRAADRHVSMHLRGDSARRAQSILHPNLTAGRERYDQVAGSFGIESRDPFMDIRVIDFCLSLPPEQLHDGGWPKMILRRAIEQRIPDDVAWRQGKEHLAGDFSRRLLDSWPSWADSMIDPSSPLADYLKPAVLNEIRAARHASPTGRTMRLFALDRFLRRYAGDRKST